MKCATGFSTHADAVEATVEALDQALAGGEQQPSLLFVFLTDSYPPDSVLPVIQERLPETPLVGFSCGGIISGKGLIKQGVGLGAWTDNRLAVTTVLEEGLGADAYKTGRRAAGRVLEAGFQRGTVFVFPDGFSEQIPSLLKGLYEGLGPAFRFIGGGGGDDLKFEKSWQFTERGIASNAVALAVVEGVPMRMAMGHGWQPCGDPMVIGEVDGRRVVEIDGGHAYDAFVQREGPIAPDDFSAYGMRHPLGFPDISGNYLIRDPLTVNPDGSINYVTEIPRNAVGYIMEGPPDQLMQSARLVAKTAVEGINPAGAICFECISRYVLLGDRFKEELELIHGALGEAVPILGCLTFGEVGSYVDFPLFHNKTLGMFVTGEQAGGDE